MWKKRSGQVRKAGREYCSYLVGHLSRSSTPDWLSGILSGSPSCRTFILPSFSILPRIIYRLRVISVNFCIQQQPRNLYVMSLTDSKTIDAVKAFMCDNADSFPMVYLDIVVWRTKAYDMLLCCTRLLTKKWSYWQPSYFGSIAWVSFVNEL